MHTDYVKTMKKNNRTLMIVLTATILFNLVLSISNVAAQEGDAQGEPQDESMSTKCFQHTDCRSYIRLYEQILHNPAKTSLEDALY